MYEENQKKQFKLDSIAREVGATHRPIEKMGLNGSMEQPESGLKKILNDTD